MKNWMMYRGKGYDRELRRWFWQYRYGPSVGVGMIVATFRLLATPVLLALILWRVWS